MIVICYDCFRRGFGQLMDIRVWGWGVDFVALPI